MSLSSHREPLLHKNEDVELRDLEIGKTTHWKKNEDMERLAAIDKAIELLSHANKRARGSAVIANLIGTICVGFAAKSEGGTQLILILAAVFAYMLGLPLCCSSRLISAKKFLKEEECKQLTEAMEKAGFQAYFNLDNAKIHDWLHDLNLKKDEISLKYMEQPRLLSIFKPKVESNIVSHGPHLNVATRV